MKVINPNIYPHGGFFFREGDGTRHAANSWSGVVARVKRYRLRQGKPTDTVENEVLFQACVRNPSLCVEDNGVTRAKLKEASLKTRVLKWLNHIRGIKEKGGDAIRFAEPGLHDARVDVCYRCPMDKGLPEGCGSCQQALKHLQEEVVGGRKTDSRIAACPVLAEYLPVSTWIEQDAVPNDALWGECWRKRTL
jgi:hypothetical protein